MSYVQWSVPKPAQNILVQENYCFSKMQSSLNCFLLPWLDGTTFKRSLYMFKTEFLTMNVFEFFGSK